MIDEHSDNHSISSFSDDSISLTDVTDISSISKESSDIDDIAEDLILISAFFTLIDDNVCNDIYLETNLHTNKEIKIPCNKHIRLKDNVTITFERYIDISNYDVIFEGGTIVFDKGFIFKRQNGKLIFRNTKIISHNDIFCFDGYEIENTKIQSYSDNVIIFDNVNDVVLKNVTIEPKINMNSIFKIVNIGKISFKNCKIIGNVNVNYGVYITFNRMNNEVNIDNTDLGEKTINYVIQFVFWEFMLGIFTSTRSPSYVACSNNNLNVSRRTCDNVKVSDQLFREIKICFGCKTNNQITIKKNVSEAAYFDTSSLNNIINNDYFGHIDKNILNTSNTKYFSLQYNYPKCKSIFVGYIKCQLYFTQQCDTYVLPKPFIFEIKDEDEQCLTINYNNNKIYDVYENTTIPLNINFKYENILPQEVNISCNYDDITFDTKNIKILKSSIVNMNVNENKNKILFNRDFYVNAMSIFNSASNIIRIKNNNKTSEILTSLDDIEYKLHNDMSVIGKFDIEDEIVCYADIVFYVMMRGISTSISIDIESEDNFDIMNKSKVTNITISEPTRIELRIMFISDKGSNNIFNSKHNKKEFKLILYSSEYKGTINCCFVQEDRVFLKYNDKYIIDNYIDIKQNKIDRVKYEIIFPYKVNEDMIGKSIISQKTAIKHSNIDNTFVVNKDEYKCEIVYDFNDNFVYGTRYISISNSISNIRLPKFNIQLLETSERGFDVYMNNKHILDIRDVKRECITSSIKFNQILNEMTINNKDYKIRGYIILKSTPIRDYKIILLGNNNVRLRCNDVEIYKDKIVLEFSSNNRCDFIVDISNVKKGICELSLISYLQPKNEVKYDYETFTFDNYGFITIKIPNINYKEIQCSSIMLGNWKIECDCEGNLVFKRRNIESLEDDDFEIVKLLN